MFKSYSFRGLCQFVSEEVIYPRGVCDLTGDAWVMCRNIFMGFEDRSECDKYSLSKETAPDAGNVRYRDVFIDT